MCTHFPQALPRIVTSLHQRKECSFNGKTSLKNFSVLNELKSLISLPCQLLAYTLLLYSCYTHQFHPQTSHEVREGSLGVAVQFL